MVRVLAPYLLAAALVGGTGLWVYRTGWQAGADHVRDEYAQAQLEVRETIRRAEAARLDAEAEREELARALEDAARADPVRIPDALSADRVRRLNSLE